MWTPPADLPPARIVRRLIRAADRAALGVHGARLEGFPYVSLTEIACDIRGRPVLLLSTLAEHTKALDADPRASLLIDGTAGYAEPLTGPRASLIGRLERVPTEAVSTRYLARHPAARMFAGFRDFGFFRFEVDKAHLVAGFGRIHWLDAADVLLEGGAGEALAEAEPDIVAHMNDDHSDAIGLYANVLLGLPGVGWRMTGVDPDGCDLARDGITARLDFDNPASDAQSARRELVLLVRKARSAPPTR